MESNEDRLTSTNAAMQRLCIRTGVAYLVIMGIGLVAIAHLIPSPLASDSAEQVRRMYIEHQTCIQVGLAIAILASVLCIRSPVGRRLRSSLSKDAGRLWPCRLWPRACFWEC